jgi:MraZ protein
MSEPVSNRRIKYFSTYLHGVDEKRRVQVPAKWRHEREEETELTLIVWPQKEKGLECLMVLTPELADKMADDLTAKSFGDPQAEVLRRALGTRSDVVTLNASGRFMIPEKMAKAAGIEKQALFAGLVDRFQIWAPERYEKVEPSDEKMTPEVLAKM